MNALKVPEIEGQTKGGPIVPALGIILLALVSCNQGATPSEKSCAKGSTSSAASSPATTAALKYGVSRLLHRESSVTIASKRQLREGGAVPGSYLVAFRGDLGSSGLSFSGFRGEHRYFYPELARRFLSDTRVKDLDYITAVNLANPTHEFKGEIPGDQNAKPFAPRFHPHSTLADLAELHWNSQDLPEMPALIAKVDFENPDTAEQVLDEWEQTGEIWYAEPNEISELSQINEQVVQDYTKAAQTAGYAWHRTIKLPEALANLAKKTLYDPVVIAVLDSGVDYEHPYLKDRIWGNPTPGAAGCGDDRYGCDLTAKVAKGELGAGTPHPFNTPGPGTSCPQDSEYNTCNHGTHVSGIIVSKLEEGAGGVCPVCKVLPLKIIAKSSGEKGKGTARDDAILKALKYIVAFGNSDRKLIRVANSSFGKYTKTRSVGLLINILKNAPYQTLIVGAAGNDDSMARSYPAAFTDAVAVASIASEGAGSNIDPLSKNSYSNFGPWVDVSAPGGTQGANIDILSTYAGGSTVKASQGTSMASPVVAGVAGLIVALFNDIGFNDLRNRIVGYADPRIYSPNVANGINFACYNPKFGAETDRRKLLGTGVVDAEKAVGTGSEFNQSTGYDNRVGGGCAVIGRSLSKRGSFSGWLIWLLPLWVFWIGKTAARSRQALAKSGIVFPVKRGSL